MALTKEQVENIKQQLVSQIENSQMENKDQLKQQLLNLDEQGLEQFLKQNNIPNPYEQGSEQGSQQSQCIFCSIINNEVPSYKINENDKSIAILEINPLSKGHSIIIPKEHIETNNLPKSSLSLAQKIAKKIKLKLKPEDVKIETSSFQGHAMINIIPIYKNQKIEKRKAEESELTELKNILETKKRGPRKSSPKSTSKASSKKIPQISFRIP